MHILRAYRFELIIQPGKARLLRRFAGSCRWLWNEAIKEQQRRHALGEKFSSYIDMAKWLTAWRNAPASAWMAATPSHAQQQTLKRLEATYKRFFAKQGGYPSFKHYGENAGLRFPDPKQFAVDRENGRVKLPKLGWLRMRMSQQVVGKVRNITVTSEGDRWFASIQVEGSEIVPMPAQAPTLGIDLGITAFLATTSDQLIAPLKALAAGKKKLRRLQRHVSRKVKRSANRKKAVKRLGNWHRKIAHQREDWLHKLSTRVANEHQVIAVEDLKIRNMSATAKGTVEAPGKNVRAKAGLNRSIMDASWGNFVQQLTYKVEWRGGRVILVNPAYTSRTCRLCGFQSAANRQSQALFKCTSCGHNEHADVHAAKNILRLGIDVHEHTQQQQRLQSEATESINAVGLTVSACGGEVRPKRRASVDSAAPMKQEPTEATVDVLQQRQRSRNPRLSSRVGSQPYVATVSKVRSTQSTNEICTRSLESRSTT
jgi:putative transposase